ncbi:hypothetical protein MXL46_08020 [Heyndrickxia sporothermodurans]|uniref:Uncharacterized protein n=1 Tax=Heyndrickxia sporothermodurans TaxID=46224 RepID=A0A150LFP0_9BACI|nr:hypothetical protein [Heyndrickxia sporothermodurans]KYD11094.1 hypothetical protein B4102_2278 [Heyndrickxia sporothermodurans]MEB6549040.1 hypothetical protein [Heyndrickxia sporothermodurans]
MRYKIYIVSETRDTFYDLSTLIPEMMNDENMTQQACIDYFMKGLEKLNYQNKAF